MCSDLTGSRLISQDINGTLRSQIQFIVVKCVFGLEMFPNDDQICRVRQDVARKSLWLCLHMWTLLMQPTSARAGPTVSRGAAAFAEGLGSRKGGHRGTVTPKACDLGGGVRHILTFAL